ncbi:uncharacterized protein BCR38DRAFT_77003 [Pseudomassariella vexata]|uniref:Uncharacterized protein n=1 Tax=Pseudomassariella vexata TaxID=1141098 RepID=A0A1Y2DG81_9PEZI|nr:uncharacterized protein BCR38DRAFT_77003 [Pseudomassariella vexata]ORY58126.1 hypothetical protein BCR38DRAFT_77003 [Pseudomassariella vexata]
MNRHVGMFEVRGSALKDRSTCRHEICAVSNLELRSDLGRLQIRRSSLRMLLTFKHGPANRGLALNCEHPALVGVYDATFFKVSESIFKTPHLSYRACLGCLCSKGHDHRWNFKLVPPGVLLLTLPSFGFPYCRYHCQNQDDPAVHSDPQRSARHP